MELFLALTVAVALGSALAARGVAVVRRDGLGHRRPPCTERHWASGTTLGGLLPPDAP